MWNPSEYTGWPVADAADAAWEQTIEEHPEFSRLSENTLCLMRCVFRMGFGCGGELGAASMARKFENLSKPPIVLIAP